MKQQTSLMPVRCGECGELFNLGYGGEEEIALIDSIRAGYGNKPLVCFRCRDR